MLSLLSLCVNTITITLLIITLVKVRRNKRLFEKTIASNDAIERIYIEERFRELDERAASQD